MSLGKFIAVDGIEGAGKSTQISFIAKYFSTKGYEVVLTREPGGTDTGEQLRNLLLDTNTNILPMSELLLMFAARYQHLHEKIAPALLRGCIVISDRWVDSSYAYQGGGRRMNIDTISQLQQLTLEDFSPDLTLFLNLPLEIALERVQQRSSTDRFETESKEFFLRTYEVYQKRLQDNPKIYNIDTSNSMEHTQKTITTLLDSL